MPDYPTLLILTSTFPRWTNDSVPDFVFEFSKRLVEQGNKRKVYVLAPHFKGSKTEESRNGIHIKRFRYAFPYQFEDIAYGGGAHNKISKNPLYLLKLLMFITSQFLNTLIICRRNKIKIINAHWLIPQGLVALMSRPFTKCKIVITVHGTDIFSLNNRLMRSIKKTVLTRADSIVVNSSATLEACMDLVTRNDYHIIPPGVDTSFFVPKKNATQKRKITELLFVGRLSKEKGLAYLIKAVKVMLGRNFKIHLNVVGTGPEELYLKQLVSEEAVSNNVTFSGWAGRNQLRDSYQNADILIGPSIITDNGTREAFGLVFAEAMACGLPVIGTRVGGITDLIKDQETGILINSKDAGAISDAITFLIKHPKQAEKLSVQGQKFIKDNFSWSQSIKMYETVLNR